MIYISIVIFLLFIAHLAFLIWVLRVVENMKYNRKRLDELEQKFKEIDTIKIDYNLLNEDL